MACGFPAVWARTVLPKHAPKWRPCSSREGFRLPVANTFSLDNIAGCTREKRKETRARQVNCDRQLTQAPGEAVGATGQSAHER